VEGRNPKDFAEKCLLLYETKVLRQQMAEAAKQKVVKEFSVERMAEEYYNLYVALAENS
jgi:glycosyltransferase involved in cell wall biosynthesis